MPKRPNPCQDCKKPCWSTYCRACANVRNGLHKRSQKLRQDDDEIPDQPDAQTVVRNHVEALRSWWVSPEPDFYTAARLELPRIVMGKGTNYRPKESEW